MLIWRRSGDFDRRAVGRVHDLRLHFRSELRAGAEPRCAGARREHDRAVERNSPRAIGMSRRCCSISSTSPTIRSLAITRSILRYAPCLALAAFVFPTPVAPPETQDLRQSHQHRLSLHAGCAQPAGSGRPRNRSLGGEYYLFAFKSGGYWHSTDMIVRSSCTRDRSGRSRRRFFIHSS
jgi:hypothetical protein